MTDETSVFTEDTRRCEHCVNYRYEGWFIVGDYCALSRPLVPCEMYEREVGSDG